MLSHLARELDERAITLGVRCETGLEMDGYPGPFGQALTYLVVNAMAHAFPEGCGGRIDGTTEAAGPHHDHLRPPVVDHGRGMAPKIKRAVLAEFKYRSCGASATAPMVFSACLLAALFLRPQAAFPQDASPAAENTGEDFFRPPANLFQPSIQYRTAPASGSNGTITNVTTETLNFRYDHSMDLLPMWILAMRFDLPTRAKNPVTSSNPDGDFLYGVGDADAQAAIIHNLDQRWAVGFGARLITPTGGETFGSGKWQIMPVVGARYALWEINSSSYFEPLVRYDVSFAGDPTRRNISNLQLAPTLNIGLPERWFITLYPSTDIRINFGDPITGQTGRLFLPFDFRVGRKLDGNAALSLELSVPIIKDYPVYNIRTQLRFDQTF